MYWGHPALHNIIFCYFCPDPHYLCGSSHYSVHWQIKENCGICSKTAIEHLNQDDTFLLFISRHFAFRPPRLRASDLPLVPLTDAMFDSSPDMTQSRLKVASAFLPSSSTKQPFLLYVKQLVHTRQISSWSTALLNSNALQYSHIAWHFNFLSMQDLVR